MSATSISPIAGRTSFSNIRDQLAAVPGVFQFLLRFSVTTWYISANVGPFSRAAAAQGSPPLRAIF